jgi:hypothetical protein
MRRALVSRLLPTVVVLALLAALAAVAQEERGRTRASITKLEFNKIRSPYVKETTTYSGAAPEYQWLQVFLEFETQGGRRGWADEVTVEWFLLVRPGDVKPMLLQETTTFVDVEEGKHHAAVYVRPGFIRRYCDSKTPNESHFAAYVEITIDGQRVARHEFSRTSQPKNWWRAKEPDVRLVADELLPPWDTPFALSDYDFYEHPKRKRQ